MDLCMTMNNNDGEYGKVTMVIDTCVWLGGVPVFDGFFAKHVLHCFLGGWIVVQKVHFHLVDIARVDLIFQRGKNHEKRASTPLKTYQNIRIDGFLSIASG